MSIKMTGTDIRHEFADTINKVCYGDEVIEVLRYDETRAYIISAERYERLTRALMTEAQ